MNKLSSPHTKSHCLRHLCTAGNNPGWMGRWNWLFNRSFPTLPVFYPVGTTLELDNFRSLMKFLLLLPRLNLAPQQKQFVVHEQYLFPLKASQNVFQMWLQETVEGIQKDWNKSNSSAPNLKPSFFFLLYIQAEFPMMQMACLLGWDKLTGLCMETTNQHFQYVRVYFHHKESLEGIFIIWHT